MFQWKKMYIEKDNKVIFFKEIKKGTTNFIYHLIRNFFLFFLTYDVQLSSEKRSLIVVARSINILLNKSN